MFAAKPGECFGNGLSFQKANNVGTGDVTDSGAEIGRVNGVHSPAYRIVDRQVMKG